MITLLQGDARAMLATMEAGSVQTIITSPPYYGLRKYSDDPREIGQEAAPDCMAWARREPPCSACYVCALRSVFAALWRVLRIDGVAWVNLGDSFSGSGKGGNPIEGKQATNKGSQTVGVLHGIGDTARQNAVTNVTRNVNGTPNKNLLGMPWRVALALQADGWILRSDIIWSKPNCMPESVTDRPTRAHEYLFLFAKSPRYFYDAAAIAEPALNTSGNRGSFRGGGSYTQGYSFDNSAEPPPITDTGATHVSNEIGTRNRRTVWSIATQPVKLAHFATMPEALIEPCILAGSSARACETCGAAWGRFVERETTGVNEARPDRGLPDGVMPQKRRAGDSSVTTTGFAPRCACPANTGAAASVVLDPFGGSGTVARVAERYQRNAILIDLNQAYIDLQEKRTDKVQIEMFT